MTAINILMGAFFVYGTFTAIYAIAPKLFGAQRGIALQGRAEHAVTVRKTLTLNQRVKGLLYQARAPITPGEFISTSAVIGIAVGFIFFSATRAILLTLVGFAGGAAIYYIYLLDQREKRSSEYESVQPQITAALIYAFRGLGQNLDGALQNLEEEGPIIVRDDWRSIRAALQGLKPNFPLIHDTLTFRSSPGFSRLVETIVLFREDTDRIIELLPGIKEELAYEVEIYRESIANLLAPRRELAFVSIMPIGMVLLLAAFGRSGFGGYYSTFMGQIIVLVAWTIAAGLYFFAATRVRKIMRQQEFTYMIPEGRSETGLTATKSAEPERAKDSPDGESEE
jgi:hypothetical protein